MSDTVERFTNRVENYAKYRPHYPQAVVEYLRRDWDLQPEWKIADVGCGTGISSELFLKNGNDVIGVEPNDAMRAAAAEYLREFSGFTSVHGTAEKTHFPDRSVDMILAGQAFHWFDQQKAKNEFKRILKPGGIVVLVWNERQLDTTPFLKEYEAFLLKYSTDYPAVRHDNFDDAALAKFYGGAFSKAVFGNIQVLDFDGLKGRMLSASYIPAEGDARYRSMIDELMTLFAKHSQNDRIDVLYDTNVYVGRL